MSEAIYEMLSLTCAIFILGILGVALNRKNFLITLMSVELTLMSLNLTFVILGVLLDDIVGHIFVFCMLAISAAESAIGLAILVQFYRLHGTIEMRSIKKLKKKK